jgi:hypothetical protein
MNVEEAAPVMYRDSLAGPSPEMRYSGVRALWLKVVLRAIFDWVTYRDSTKLMQRKLADNAYTWLFKPSHLFNSFENICRYLDIDADTVRERAQSMTRRDIAKIEYLEREGEGPCPWGSGVMLLEPSVDENDEVA